MLDYAFVVLTAWAAARGQPKVTMERSYVNNTLLTLPSEILVHIISFVLPLRERIKLRHVSRRLRTACETPSLWRNFAWHCYQSGDEGCVNSVLKTCGEHVISLSFPRLDTYHDLSHRTWNALINALSYCRNAVKLSLPTFGIESEEVKSILVHMEQLQSLTIHWFRDILKLLKRITKNGKNLKEVTVTEFWLETRDSHSVAEVVKPWVQYWMENNFLPRKLNLVCMDYDVDRDGSDLEEYLLIESHKSMSTSPAGSYGQINLYTGFKMPLDLAPVLPIFQIEFGQTTSFPFALNTDSCGFSKSDYLILTECIHHRKVKQKAILKQIPLVVQIDGTACNFRVLNELSTSSCDVHSNQLERLAVACPNLRRLNLEQNKNCLKMLQGLRAIASFCLNLEGLNLKGIPTENIESQAYLWEY